MKCHLTVGATALAGVCLAFGPVYPSPGWPCCTAAMAADLAAVPPDLIGPVASWVADHPMELCGWVLAALGLVSQLAAACNLGRLGRVSTRLQAAVRWLAGNWGF